MRRILYHACSFVLVTCFLTLLAGCGGSNQALQRPQASVSTTSPASDQGQRLLARSAQLLDSAQTLHGVFNTSLSGQLVNGEVDSEIWRLSPDKSRVRIVKSTLSQFTTGTLIVNDGKRVWQYEPAKKVVYTGQSASLNATATPGTRTGLDRGDAQQLILGSVQIVFTHSIATLISSTESVGGHSVYTIHVSPSSQNSGPAGFAYDGTVSLDQRTKLPLTLDLAVSGIGQVQIAIPSLLLNQPLTASLFTFTPPPGVPEQPFPSVSPGGIGDALTLQQAEQQAHYHLLRIPSAQTAYTLQHIDALGAPGNQIYTFAYTFHGQNFTLSQGKALANLPLTGSSLGLRGTQATLQFSGNTSTLSWTENGVGIQLSGPLTKDEIVTIARLLV